MHSSQIKEACLRYLRCPGVTLAVLLLFCVLPKQAPAAQADANDTARFLAGLPPSAGSPLKPVTGDKSWQEHARYFDSAWADLELHQLSRIRTWANECLGETYAKPSVIYYMFSGPDYLYVDSFFPNGSTYVLCGIEPVGTLPEIVRIPRGTLAAGLHHLQVELNSVLSFGFFITKEMKTELENHELAGTLPIICVFMARSNKVIQEVTFVGLDKSGALQPSGGKGLIPGVKITFTKQSGGPLQTLYYFCSNISDDGVKDTPGFLKFCGQLGPGNSLVKAASYLMHEKGFTKIRSCLLDQSQTLVQDDSGIPVRYFTPDKWKLRLFGSYHGPIELFKQWYQPELVELYNKSNPVPLSFGIGYKHHASESTLMLATHK